MNLSKMDIELIETVATERMDQHIAAHRKATSADREHMQNLDKLYFAVLEKLDKQDADIIHEFHDYSFLMSAKEEKMLYKNGVLDGLRLAKFILELQ